MTQDSAAAQTVVAYLVVDDGKKALEFYREAFGAENAMDPMFTEDGRVAHAELRIGQSVVMIGDAFPEWGVRAPAEIGGSPVAFMVRVDDADAAVERAIAAGGKAGRPVEDQFYGARSGEVTDPFGYRWTMAQHLEDVPAEELDRRWRVMEKGGDWRAADQG